MDPPSLAARLSRPRPQRDARARWWPARPAFLPSWPLTPIRTTALPSADSQRPPAYSQRPTADSQRPSAGSQSPRNPSAHPSLPHPTHYPPRPSPHADSQRPNPTTYSHRPDPSGASPPPGGGCPPPTNRLRAEAAHPSTVYPRRGPSTLSRGPQWPLPTSVSGPLPGRASAPSPRARRRTSAPGTPAASALAPGATLSTTTTRHLAHLPSSSPPLPTSSTSACPRAP